MKPSRNVGRNNNGIFGLGITEVILGLTAVALEISALIIHNKGKASDESLCIYPIFYALLCSGIWCGALAVITGTLGIVYKEKPIRALQVINITMAVITAVIMPFGVTLSGLAALASIFCTTEMVILHAVIALICLILFVMSIVHASLCCTGTSISDGDDSSSTEVSYYQRGSPYDQRLFYGNAKRKISGDGASKLIRNTSHAQWCDLSQMQLLSWSFKYEFAC